MPPPEAYHFQDTRKDAVAHDDATKNDRRVYFGWNNLTEYEQNGINALKQYVQEKGVEVPQSDYWEERDWLKWI